MKTCIYHLENEAGLVHYVGRCINPEERLRQHLGSEKGSMGPVWEWCRFQWAIRFMPNMRIVAVVQGNGVVEEREEIRRVKATGVRLLNVSGIRDCRWRKLPMWKGDCAKDMRIFIARSVIWPVEAHEQAAA